MFFGKNLKVSNTVLKNVRLTLLNSESDSPALMRNSVYSVDSKFRTRTALRSCRTVPRP